MMIFNYCSKKVLAGHVGERLDYTETSIRGNEMPENGTGRVLGCNRPFSPEFPKFNKRAFDGTKKDGSPKKAREFFCNVTVENFIITKVE